MVMLINWCLCGIDAYDVMPKYEVHIVPFLSCCFVSLCVNVTTALLRPETPNTTWHAEACHGVSKQLTRQELRAFLRYACTSWTDLGSKDPSCVVMMSEHHQEKPRQQDTSEIVTTCFAQPSDLQQRIAFPGEWMKRTHTLSPTTSGIRVVPLPQQSTCTFTTPRPRATRTTFADPQRAQPPSARIQLPQPSLRPTQQNEGCCGGHW